MRKLTEALKKATGLSAEAVKEIEAAVSQMVAESISEKEKAMQSEFKAKLEEAFEQADAAIAEAEAKADEGYQQAYAIIMEYAQRLEAQSEAYEDAQEEGYGQAYAEMEKLEAEKNEVEAKVYEEFNNKLTQMRDLFVEKLHSYLELSKAEIYSEARRDLLNDPRTAEHRVAIEKIAETVATYLDDEDLSNATSGRLEEAHKVIEELRGNLRVVEQRNVHLSMKNQKLDEQVKSKDSLLSEATKNERTERTKTAKNVSGRGQRVLESEKVIAEFNNPAASKKNNEDSDEQNLIENNDILNDYLVLSGIVQPE